MGDIQEVDEICDLDWLTVARELSEMSHAAEGHSDEVSLKWYQSLTQCYLNTHIG